VRSTKAQFSLENPLDGRWIRYWPNPFHPSQTTELRKALENAPEAEAEKVETEKQDLRLLYVGWTRARDRLVLAFGKGQWMLDELKPPPMPEQDETIEWGGVTVAVQVRPCEGNPDDETQRAPDEAVDAAGPFDHPPAYISPSTLEGSATSVEVTHLGERMLVTGDPDMNALGQAVHGFLAIDRPNLPREERVSLAAASLAQWEQSGMLRPERMVEGSDALAKWADTLAPGATWHRELPIAGASAHRGVADLVLETKSGFLLVDHKSFPGRDDIGTERAKTFAAQLQSYSSALEPALAKPCLGMFVHLALLGRIVRMGPVRGGLSGIGNNSIASAI
jgi:hypothetical protein